MSQTTEIVVFVKPDCVQCDATYKALEKEELVYEVVDVSFDCEAHDFVMSLGYLQVPVVVVGRLGRPDDHWPGFRPDRIKNIKNNNALFAA